MSIAGSTACSRKSVTNAPAIMVVVIASDLRLSTIIPTIPNIRAIGTDVIMSNPPRAPIGLPQPGFKMISVSKAAAAMPSSTADGFPNRISNSNLLKAYFPSIAILADSVKMIIFLNIACYLHDS